MIVDLQNKQKRTIDFLLKWGNVLNKLQKL